MNNHNLIIENIDNPHELERMYRKDPKAFKNHSHKHGAKPDSQVLGAWYERLHFKETANAEKSLFQKVSYLWAC